KEEEKKNENRTSASEKKTIETTSEKSGATQQEVRQAKSEKKYIKRNGLQYEQIKAIATCVKDGHIHADDEIAIQVLEQTKRMTPILSPLRYARIISIDNGNGNDNGNDACTLTLSLSQSIRMHPKIVSFPLCDIQELYVYVLPKPKEDQARSSGKLLRRRKFYKARRRKQKQKKRTFLFLSLLACEDSLQ
ncbi:hypothetical protein RFI_05941, partial [Reticulomyxa filosa]